MPMANDSTTYISSDVKNKTSKKPRKSSIMFIRQFARVYFNYGESDQTSYVLN